MNEERLTNGIGDMERHEALKQDVTGLIIYTQFKRVFFFVCHATDCLRGL